MNLLQLVNFARQEGGASGDPLSTLIGGNAEVVRYVSWVINSWNDLQRTYSKARFMRSPFTLALVNTQWSYPPTDPAFTLDAKGGIRTFKLDSMRAATDIVAYTDEQFLPWTDYDNFLLMYRYGNMRAQVSQRPTLYSVAPDRSMVFGPVPTGVCTIIGEYYRQRQTLALDADVPYLPIDFHELIAWRALRLYGSFDAATETYQRATVEMARIQAELEEDQLEWAYPGDPLA